MKEKIIEIKVINRNNKHVDTIMRKPFKKCKCCSLAKNRYVNYFYKQYKLRKNNKIRV